MKFVRFQLSTNIGAILSFLGAAIVGLPAPLSAIQVLWVNIIVDRAAGDRAWVSIRPAAG